MRRMRFHHLVPRGSIDFLAQRYVGLHQDLALPVGPSATRAGRILRALTAAAGSLVFTAHVYYAERLWDRILSGPALFAANRPEKSVGLVLPHTATL